MYARCECLQGAAIRVQKQLQQVVYCFVDWFRMQQPRCRSLLRLLRVIQCFTKDGLLPDIAFRSLHLQVTPGLR